MLPVAQSAFADQTASRKRSSLVRRVAAVPDCAAAGMVLLPLSVPVPAQNGEVTFFASGVPLIVKTAKLFAADALQVASLTI